MTTYLKEIFTMFNETLGFENIHKDFENEENLKIDRK
jgi:oligoendopeptidase F